MSERKPWQVIHVSGSAWWDVMDGSDLVARFTNSKDAHQVVADHNARAVIKQHSLPSAIVRLLPKGQEVTVQEIRRQVKEQGVEASEKQVFNAIGYLTRKKRITRLKYGRYIFNGGSDGGDANCQASTPTCNQAPVNAGAVVEPVAWQWCAGNRHWAHANVPST